jgi:hypothetical protein
MFEEGSTPIQVAIVLNLREKDVSEFYREYWSLNDMYQLNQIYAEIKDDIWSVIELHRRMKIEGLSPQQASRILKTIITLEYKIRDLEGEQARLEISNKQAAKTFQQFTDFIQKDHKTMEENDNVICQQRREIENLNIGKTRLENIIDSIQPTNETCIKIKQIVKQEIESIIPDPKKLLKLALASIFESSRKHPGKFQALYYNMSSSLSVEQLLSQPSSNSQRLSRYGYSEDENEKVLLNEAELSYNRIVDAITNHCINQTPKVPNDNNTELSPETFQIASIQGIENNSEIFDTRNLSEVNLLYNNITFHVYPFPKITNEKNTSNEIDDWLIENELEQHDLQDQQE